MKDNPQLQHDDLPIWIALKIKFERLQASNTRCKTSVIRLRDLDDPYDDAHLEGENKDELPAEKVSQELVEEMSEIVNEAKLSKVVNEIKEILSLPFLQKPTPVVQSCQRDPKSPGISLVNQDLLYLKKGNSGPEKIVLSLHKFPTVIFPDDDIKERTSIWVEKYVKKFNPYA
nr:hypothetical protein [Tanacetum cinerariifolium]